MIADKWHANAHLVRHVLLAALVGATYLLGRVSLPSAVTTRMLKAIGVSAAAIEHLEQQRGNRASRRAMAQAAK